MLSPMVLIQHLFVLRCAGANAGIHGWMSVPPVGFDFATGVIRSGLFSMKIQPRVGCYCPDVSSLHCALPSLLG